MNNLEIFLEALLVEKNSSKCTILAYRVDLMDFFLFFKSKNIYNIEHGDIEIYMAKLKKNYSHATTLRKLSALKSYYKFLLREGIIKTNPMLKVESFKAKKSLPNYLTKDEIQQLLNFMSQQTTFSGLRNYAMIEILYATGVRISELISLKIEDVLPLTKDKSYITVHGKGNKERVIIFNSRSIIALKKYIDKLATFEAKWLFLCKNTSSSKQITRQAVGKILKKAAIDAGINPQRVHPHAIRHSFATHLLNAGMKIKVIKELLGHSSISTTQIYTHVADEKLKNILEENHPLASKKLIK